MVQHLKEKLREICDFLAFFVVFLLFGASCYAAFQSILLKRWIYSVYFTLFFAFLLRICLGKFFPLFDTRYLPRATLRYFVGK